MAVSSYVVVAVSTWMKSVSCKLRLAFIATILSECACISLRCMWCSHLKCEMCYIRWHIKRQFVRLVQTPHSCSLSDFEGTSNKASTKHIAKPTHAASANP